MITDHVEMQSISIANMWEKALMSLEIPLDTVLSITPDLTIMSRAP